jgi:hypothetical protein
MKNNQIIGSQFAGLDSEFFPILRTRNILNTNVRISATNVGIGGLGAGENIGLLLGARLRAQSRI